MQGLKYRISMGKRIIFVFDLYEIFSFLLLLILFDDFLKNRSKEFECDKNKSLPDTSCFVLSMHFYNSPLSSLAITVKNSPFDKFIDEIKRGHERPICD